MTTRLSRIETFLILFFGVFFCLIIVSVVVKGNRRRKDWQSSVVFNNQPDSSSSKSIFKSIPENPEKYKKKTHFGFIVFATGYYSNFVERLLSSAHNHLFKGYENTHDFTFFVFSDSHNISLSQKSVFVYQRR